MLEVGSNDAFERQYTGKFRQLAAKYGEFVTYERDRAARDIGIHLTRKLDSGTELMTSALCWFQLKGKKSSTLAADEIREDGSVGVRVKTRHLKFWYLQAITTYLVVYLEAVDRFVVADIKKLIDDRFGPDVMRLKEETVTVNVPVSSQLDDEAFFQIQLQSDIKEWQKAIQADEETARHCRRDYGVIWRLGTAQDRHVRHRLRIIDWITKMRSELYLEESPDDSEDGDWTTVREHWQFALQADEIEKAYPYCDFQQDDDVDLEDALHDNDCSVVELSNGQRIIGHDAAGEYLDYTVDVSLNELGIQLFESVTFLKEIGLIEVDASVADCISVAPFHGRSV